LPGSSPSLRRSCFPLLLLFLACLRLTHLRLLWADEDYHLAAALQILHGKLPYLDFWYDKPPLSAYFYLLNGAMPGWSLRVLGAAYVLSCCFLAYRLAAGWWSEAEGRVAAVLLAFSFAFDLPSAALPLAPDALMVLPHLAAIYYARKGAALRSGALAGIAFLINTKALFVLASCAVFFLSIQALSVLLVGFALPVLLCLALMLATGTWPGYLQQVWRWGLLYARLSPVTNPFLTGIVRTLHWIGFHAALVLGAAVTLTQSARRERWQLLAWIALSFAAVCLGTRFAEHYFLQMLPPLTVCAARGLVLFWERRHRLAFIVIFLAALVPAIRFGPRYFTLLVEDLHGRDTQWLDAAMDLDSQSVARLINSRSTPDSTLFVWGYRPNIYVYSRLVPPGLFSDSQPLNGVPADRHLSAATPIYSGPAAANRAELVQTKPTFIVDGLSTFNPHLQPDIYPELKQWMASYRLVGRTRFSLIYERIAR
jgi:hypothetical protein